MNQRSLTAVTFSLFILALFLATRTSLPAQEVAWVRTLWATNPGSVQVLGITTDNEGNIYLVGLVAGTATFGDTTVSTSGTSDRDPLLISFSPDGKVRWVRVMKNMGEYFLHRVVVPEKDGVYVSGHYSREFTIDDGRHDTTLTTPLQMSRYLVARFDRSGNFHWARQVGGSNTSGLGLSPAAPHDGSGIIVAGSLYVRDTIVGVPLAADSSAFFTFRLDSSGNVLWVRKDGISKGTTVQGMAIDRNGNMTLTGIYTSSLTLGSQTFGLEAGVMQGWYIVSYTPDGSLRWHVETPRRASELPGGVGVDDQGNAAVVGTFGKDTVVIGGDTIARGANRGSFLARYGSDGRLLWARKVSGRENDTLGIAILQGLTTDGPGNIYITGYYEGLAVIDSTTLYPPGGSRLRNDSIGHLCAKFNPDGLMDWVIPFRGYSGWSRQGMALDRNREPIVAATFTSSARIGDSIYYVPGEAWMGLVKLRRTKPGTPRIVFPGNGGDFFRTNTPFIWRPAFEATEYRIQFARDTLFRNIAFDSILSGTEAFFRGMAYGTRYYWRLCGINGADTGAWTPRRTFTSRTAVALSDHRWFTTGLFTPKFTLTDPQKNTYVVGANYGKLEIGGVKLPAPSSNFTPNTFLVKYDPFGGVIWVRQIGELSCGGIDIDQEGDVYLSFTYTGQLNLQDTILAGSYPRSECGVLKLNSSGTFLWARSTKSTGSTAGSIWTLGMAAFSDGGCVFVLHVTSRTPSFEGVSVQETEGSRIIVAWYDRFGEIRQVRASETDGSIVTLQPYDAATDRSGNCYVTGIHRASLRIGDVDLPGASRSGSYSNFLLKFGNDGTPLWGKTVEKGNLLNTDGFAGSDSAGRVYWSGELHGTGIFDTGEPGRVDSIGSPSSDILYLARYSGEGKLDWVKSVGERAELRGMAVTPEGRSYITGEYEIRAKFDTTLCKSYGTRSDAMVVSASPEGEIDWVTKAGSYRDSTLVTGYGIGYDRDGGVYWTGIYTGPQQFGPYDLRGQGMFLTKLDPENSGVYVLLAPFNGTTVKTRSVLLRWAPVAGAVSYDLEVSLSPDFHTLFVQRQGLTATEYRVQGLKPNDRIYWRIRANVPGEQFPLSDIWTFTVDANAPLLAVEEREERAAPDRSFSFALYPNPTDGKIALAYHLRKSGRVRVDVYDGYGRLVTAEAFGEEEPGAHVRSLDLSSLTTGMYFCRLTVGEESRTERLQVVR